MRLDHACRPTPRSSLASAASQAESSFACPRQTAILNTFETRRVIRLALGTKMDPLSLAATVLGLAGTVLTVATTVYDLVASVRDAESDAQTFCAELDLLKSILVRLKGGLEDGTLPPCRFDKDSILVVSLQACKNQLEAMGAKLDGVSRKRLEKLSWHFKQKGHVKDLEVIRNVSNLLHFSLSVTGW